MGLNWSDHTEDIDAPVETCFAAIVDYESFPRWQDAVESVEVLSRTPDGLGQDVKLFVDAKIRKIDYVLRYSYTRPTEILWDFVEGNGMRDVDGVYTLEPLGPERTRATYKLGADPDLPVPGMILRRTHKQLVKRSVEDLKTEAERRHAAGESAQTATPQPEQTATESVPIEDEPATAEPTAPPPPPPVDDWVPKAEREAERPPSEASTGGSGPGAGPRSASGSVTGVASELVDQAVHTGRAVAEGAVRAGMGVAEQAVQTTKGVADGLLRRVNEKLNRDR